MRTLLEKTRSLNKLLQKSAGYPVDFKEIALLFGEAMMCNVYILDRRGKLLGFSYGKAFTCEVTKSFVEYQGSFPEEYNEKLLKINETQANVAEKVEYCLFDSKVPCKFKNKLNTYVPIIGAGSRLGSLVLAKLEGRFTYEDLILAEYGATVVGMEILRSRAGRMEEEARMRVTVQVALSTLSYSELDAIKHIFAHLDGEEGLLVASKIADEVGITRSVIVNALRKFESAGVIESKSLGMKGTYIRVLNDRLLEELEKLNQIKV